MSKQNEFDQDPVSHDGENNLTYNESFKIKCSGDALLASAIQMPLAALQELCKSPGILDRPNLYNKKLGITEESDPKNPSDLGNQPSLMSEHSEDNQYIVGKEEDAAWHALLAKEEEDLYNTLPCITTETPSDLGNQSSLTGENQDPENS